MPLQQDQEDLSAMIDDLETFSNTLSVGPSEFSVILNKIIYKLTTNWKIIYKVFNKAR